MQEVLSEKKVLEELDIGCQWPIGTIARSKNNEINLYSILLTKQGEILKKESINGSLKDSIELGKKIGKLFKDYV